MVKSLTNIRILAILIAIIALWGGGCSADVIYTVSATGTILSGTDYGAFGGLGNIAGQSFTVTDTFDETAGTSSTITTVDGSSYITIGNPPNYGLWNMYYISDTLHQIGGGYSDEVWASVSSGPLSGQIFGPINSSLYYGVTIAILSSVTPDFLTSDDPSQNFSYSVPADFDSLYAGNTEFVGFSAPDPSNNSDASQFLGTLSTITLNAGSGSAGAGSSGSNSSQAVPEPESLGLFSVELIAFGWVSRKTFFKHFRGAPRLVSE